jgi:16S rRNA (adenine1518-N6/adenine1519-N6)-dimethyltransferase
MSKYLGQHFLKNKAIIKKIVDALQLEDGDTVVEIGPGNGSLIKELGSRNKELRIIGIEKDKSLFDKLVNSKFIRERNGVEIIEGDVLKIFPKISTHYSLLTTYYKLVGNIPYYITGYLLRILGEIRKKPSLIVFTIQKEVAERLTAKPPKMNPVRDRETGNGAKLPLTGTQTRPVSNGMNILGASVQVWGNIEILSYVSKNDFNPKPKVDSAVIKITPLKKEVPEKYYETVKTIFRHPRKTILNNLLVESKEKKEVILEKIERAGLDPKMRPQNLGVEDIVRLSKND